MSVIRPGNGLTCEGTFTPVPKLRRLGDDELRDLHEVYCRNVSAVYAFFAYSVGPQTAEDLTAATFERVVRSWQRYDARRASVRTWVLVIARNLLADHFRRQSFRGGPSFDEHPALAGSTPEHDDPAERFAAVDGIKSWLLMLQPREREVLALRYGADLPTREIARCLGLSEANVHQIVSRALRRLRTILTDAEKADTQALARDDARISGTV
jgi:RNA polymerase sigma factor (sigma-70 family)